MDEEMYKFKLADWDAKTIQFMDELKVLMVKTSKYKDE